MLASVVVEEVVEGAEGEEVGGGMVAAVEMVVEMVVAVGEEGEL